jgi:hypothetical protein
VVFCWVPGHVGIVGNELADQEAKSSSYHAITDFDSVLSTDIRCEYKQTTSCRNEASCLDCFAG